MPENEFSTQRIQKKSIKRLNNIGTSGMSFHEVLEMVLDVFDNHTSRETLDRVEVGHDGRVRLSHLKNETIEYRVVK